MNQPSQSLVCNPEESNRATNQDDVRSKDQLPQVGSFQKTLAIHPKEQEKVDSRAVASNQPLTQPRHALESNQVEGQDGEAYHPSQDEGFKAMLAGLPDGQRAIVKNLSVAKLDEVAQRWLKKRNEQIGSKDATKQ
ncbi:hypothetical protein ACHAPO_009630 [Fusarium lateritium]